MGGDMLGSLLLLLLSLADCEQLFPWCFAAKMAWE